MLQLPRPTGVRFLLGLAALLSLAWTPYRTKASQCTVRWYGEAPGQAALLAPTNLTVQVDPRGVSGVSAADVRQQLGMALQAWNEVRCPVDGPDPAPLAVTLSLGELATPTAIGAACSATDSTGACTGRASNGNFVHVIDDPDQWPYGNSVFALTVLTYNTCTGEVVDGDILLDGGNHQFCSGSCGAIAQDLRNTLTHEVGHLLGLDHSDQPLATMYFSAPAGEVHKSSLYLDDRQGICAMYTGGCGPQHSCQPASPAPPADEGGCTASQKRSAWGPWALALGVSLIAAGLRRRRQGKWETAP